MCCLVMLPGRSVEGWVWCTRGGRWGCGVQGGVGGVWCTEGEVGEGVVYRGEVGGDVVYKGGR